MLSRIPKKSLLGPLALSITLFFGVAQQPLWAQHKSEKEAQEIKKEENDNDAERVGTFHNQLIDRLTNGDADAVEQARMKEYEEYKRMTNPAVVKTQSMPAWNQIASSQSGHVSGRARQIIFEPGNPKVAYVATAQSGLWRTDDITVGQPIWTNLSERWPTLVMGALGIDPKNTSVLYAGTGEVYGGFSAPDGVGILKSTDRGANWTRVATAADVSGSCSQIIVDPNNSDVVWVATGASQQNSQKGLLKSTDAGQTWKVVNPSGAGTALSIAFDPKNPNNMYMGTVNGQIWYSTNDGQSWTKAGKPTNMSSGPGGTIVVAVAPSSPNVVYATAGKPGGNAGATYGMLMSTDYGVTWVAQNTTTAILGTQSQYANALAVNPNNPAEIMVGGLDIYLSQDSGKTFPTKTDWTADENAANYAHADIHYLVYNINQYYACTDGGIAASPNGSNWTTTINNGINSLQFVGVDAAKDFSFILGGTQDNGVNRATPTDNQWAHTRGGDAGLLWVSPSNSNDAYSTYVQTDIRKTQDGGKTWLPGPNGNQNFITNTKLIQEGAQFYPAFDVDPTGNYVIFGANRHVWMSTNGLFDGFSVSSAASLPSATFLHVDPINVDNMWAGFGSGYISRTTDATLDFTWTALSTGKSAKVSGAVTGIMVNTNDEQTVYAVTAGLGHQHFWISHDGGATFDTVAGNNFPNISANSLTYDPKKNVLFAGLDNMVIYSKDQGKTWGVYGDGLPMVQVLTLKVKGDKLLAGTFGRGCYYIDVPAKDQIADPDPGSIEYRNVRGAVVAANMSLEPSYPNPVMKNNGSAATISFTLQSNAQALVKLYDNVGHELRTITSGYFTSGAHSVWLSTSDLAPGTYFYSLTSGGTTLSQKLIIVQ